MGVVAACDSQNDAITDFRPAAEGDPPLAVLDAPDPDGADQAAAGPGVLTLEQGCVFLVLDDGTPVLLAWSPGLTEWSTDSSAVRFTFIEGRSVVHIGDTVMVGGGEVSADIPWLHLPDSCPDGETFGVSSIDSIDR